MLLQYHHSSESHKVKAVRSYCRLNRTRIAYRLSQQANQHSTYKVFGTYFTAVEVMYGDWRHFLTKNPIKGL